MNKRSYNKTFICENDPESLFWNNELYRKSYFENRKNKEFRYYDETSILKYLFFHWVNKWASVLSRKYLDPYKLHPLHVSDQILKWEPMFSKHISDGLVRMDLYEATKYSKRPIKPYFSTLLRAIFLTFWKRIIAVLVGIVLSVAASLSISVLIKKMLEILNSPTINVANTIVMLLTILVFQIIIVLFLENINFYVNRMVYTLHYLYATIAYRHAICHRRVYFNNIDGTNTLNTCNRVLHTCEPDSQCSKNPLFCPAQRYHNREMGPKIFTYVFYDSFYIAMGFESTKIIVHFLVNYIYGVYLLSRHVKAKLWVLYLAGALFLFFMVCVEALSAFIYKFILIMRDYKVTKYNDILGSLGIIKKMFLDDIGFNIITQTRNDELSLIFVKIFITFLNVGLYITSINILFYIIKWYFVKSVNDAEVVTDINTAAFMTTMYIYLRIVTSMFLIPRAINIVGMAYASFRRLNKYLSECSPNFYVTDNIYTGSANIGLSLPEKTNQIPSDVVVYYKNATFAWIDTCNDLMRKKYDTLLENVNFELKRGQMTIVTGSKGSGKSNFIKSMLGEMTLVGGSMAVVPLYTSMPIFYASQDIFLERGTIRSNITFGHKFDEHLYNTVLKAVELEYDISTWEKGDLREVSDNATSLSGGQRVRMELARAVYAYLVFHKVNKEYNNSKCSFLMCLDASFHGLDPYVSKNIFNNLFNVKTGLLVKDDLSIVLTSTKLIIDTCTKTYNPEQFKNENIYKIKNKKLIYSCTIHEFIKNKREDSVDHKYITTDRGPHCSLNRFSNDMISMCTAGTSDKTTRPEIIRELYKESFIKYIKDHIGNARFNPYFVYMKPAAVLFAVYIILTVALNVLDYVKFVLSTNLSDYITNRINDFEKGAVVDLGEIKAHSKSALKLTTIFVLTIIILSVLATVALTAGSLVSCRKLHEYSLNTIFNYSTSVVKIKRQINQVITFLYEDLMMTDDITGLFIALLLFSLIQTLTNLITLFYLIPISVPFVVITAVVIYIYNIRRYIRSAVTLNFGFMESLAQTNRVIVRSMSGGSIYRSFNRNSDLLGDFLEHREYSARSKFLFVAAGSWSTIMFTWVFSLTTFIILVISIILDKYTKHKMTPGYFGLALSLCMNVVKSFSNFALMYSCAQMLMGSIERFQYFIPPGKRLKFDKCPNTHEEYIVNTVNRNLTNLDKKQLLRRRAIEFKTENKKLYGLRRMFYHPRITIIDVDDYLNTEHIGVQLNDVCVYTTLEQNPETMILKHLKGSACKSEIIGMVGKTGAGKTTIFSVLQNIVENRTGQVLLDGKELNDIPKVVLRQIIGVIPQLPFVFKGWTVRRFLDPRKLFTDDDIKYALNQCGLLNFVNTLHGSTGLDTVIIPEDHVLDSKSSKGQSNNSKMNKNTSTELNKPSSDSSMLLSNTQIRTLMLARLVLYRNFFRVIIVDQPPNQEISDRSYKEEELGFPINDLLQKYFSHCTTFVTAHDVNTLKKCTSVWVIHDGFLMKTYKASDIPENVSIASIIEESVK